MGHDQQSHNWSPSYLSQWNNFLFQSDLTTVKVSRIDQGRRSIEGRVPVLLYLIFFLFDVVSYLSFSLFTWILIQLLWKSIK